MANSMRQLYADMDDCANKALSLDVLGKLHRWGVDGNYHSGVLERPDPLSLKWLCFRHGKVLKLLWLNTYLMPETKLETPVKDATLHDAAPARMQRAQEIGRLVKNEDFDAAILCEVWTDDSRMAILNNWPSPPVWIKGPEKSYEKVKVEVPGVSDVLGFFGIDASVTVLTIERISSGLFTLLPGNFGLLGHNRERFSCEGDVSRDADAWSNKGMLQVVIETGYPGKIELYSTHLISGNDLIKSSGDDEDVVSDVARSQIDQLVSFVSRTHNPSNIIVLAGDFNINAKGSHYEYLRKRMEDDLGLEDAWARYAEARYCATLGGTTSDTAFPDDGVNGKYICDRIGADDCPGGPVNDSRRIDYVFVQRPSSQHNAYVEVSRPRRRHFKRDPSSPGYGDIQTLSDHVGVELRLFISEMHIPAEPHLG